MPKLITSWYRHRRRYHSDSPHEQIANDGSLCTSSSRPLCEKITPVSDCYNEEDHPPTTNKASSPNRRRSSSNPSDPLTPKRKPKDRKSTSNALSQSKSSDSSDSNTTTSTIPIHEDDYLDDDDHHLFISPFVPLERLGVKYSLRSCISDGSMVQPHQRGLYPNGIHCRVSHWSERNGRGYMEDRYVVESIGTTQVPIPNTPMDVAAAQTQTHKPQASTTVPLSWGGVFDGHGGDRASQYCSDRLLGYVKNQPHYPSDLPNALRSGFNTIDADFVNSGNTDGSTACVCMMVGHSKIICANAGDSRAILIKLDGSVVELSVDHKPGLSRELRRISDLGGKVIYVGKWRLEGVLAVSRGVGDLEMKPYVTADPDVKEYDIEPGDAFLVIASDGVWDVLKNHQVAQFVLAESLVADQNGNMRIDPEKFKWTAKNLCAKAGRLGSSDNLTAVVMDLQSHSAL